jgi:hypothetical protein
MKKKDEKEKRTRGKGVKRKTNRNLDKEGPKVAHREPARVGGDGGEYKRGRRPTNPTTPIVVTSSGRPIREGQIVVGKRRGGRSHGSWS